MQQMDVEGTNPEREKVSTKKLGSGPTVNHCLLVQVNQLTAFTTMNAVQIMDALQQKSNRRMNVDSTDAYFSLCLLLWPLTGPYAIPVETFILSI